MVSFKFIKYFDFSDVAILFCCDKCIDLANFSQHFQSLTDCSFFIGSLIYFLDNFYKFALKKVKLLFCFCIIFSFCLCLFSWKLFDFFFYIAVSCEWCSHSWNNILHHYETHFTHNRTCNPYFYWFQFSVHPAFEPFERKTMRCFCRAFSNPYQPSWHEWNLRLNSICSHLVGRRQLWHR